MTNGNPVPIEPASLPAGAWTGRGAEAAPAPDPRGRLAALIGLPAAGALLAAIAGWEGYAPDPYVDLAGVPTVCWGDTEDVRPGRRYSRAECEARLERQALAHVRPVLDCVPQLRGHRGALVAAGSLAYNIGAGAFCRSTAARRFRAGDVRGGCNALLAWNKARVNGRLVPVRGLTNRRRFERDLCLRGLPVGGGAAAVAAVPAAAAPAGSIAAPGAAAAAGRRRADRVPCEVMHLFYEEVRRTRAEPRPPQTPSEWNRVLRKYA